MKPTFPLGTIDRFFPNTLNYIYSNFYPCTIRYDGLTFSSVEHAYQAFKSTDLDVRKLIQACPTAASAKKQGREIKMREDWNEIKFQIMEQLIEQKFAPNNALSKQLLSTGNAELIEGNYWHDLIWGQCFCFKHNWDGNNQLGKIIMARRKALRKDYEQHRTDKSTEGSRISTI